MPRAPLPSGRRVSITLTPVGFRDSTVLEIEDAESHEDSEDPLSQLAGMMSSVAWTSTASTHVQTLRFLQWAMKPFSLQLNANKSNYNPLTLTCKYSVVHFYTKRSGCFSASLWVGREGCWDLGVII
jgi:hypothetical protein